MAGTSRDEEMTDMHLLDVLNAVTIENLDDVYTNLGLEEKDVSNAKLNIPNARKQTRNILNLWRSRNGVTATKGALIDAMDNVDICKTTADKLKRIWKLTPPAKPDPVPVRPIGADDKDDIMISYQWDAQPRMIKLRDELRKAGYKVWMDIDKMEDDMDDCMAKAVAEAQVVFWCFSKKYQDSENCKKEAQYSKKKKKQIIGLKYEDFEPSGWLDINLGQLKYYNVTSDKSMMKVLPNIITELKNKGVPCQLNVE